MWVSFSAISTPISLAVCLRVKGIVHHLWGEIPGITLNSLLMRHLDLEGINIFVSGPLPGVGIKVIISMVKQPAGLTECNGCYFRLNVGMADLFYFCITYHMK